MDLPAAPAKVVNHLRANQARGTGHEQRRHPVKSPLNRVARIT
jgi:hypothetical protein